MTPILIILLLVFMWLVLSRIYRRGVAKKLMKTAKDVYSAPHQYRRATIREIPGLDEHFYNEVRSWLEREGFMFLGDFENITLTAAIPDGRSLVRCFSGDNARLMACCYHFKLRGPAQLHLAMAKLPSEARTIDIETEFTDGTFLMTSNTRETDRSGDVPGIKRIQLPCAATWSDILATHRRALETFLSANPNIHPLSLPTIEDYQAAQHRQQMLKNQHKKSIGYLNEQELRLIAGGKLDGSVEVAIKEIEKLKQAEAARESRRSPR